MKTRNKVLSGVAVLLAVGLSVLLLVISHDSPCGMAATLPANTPRMTAIVYRCYGAADVLKLEQITKPVAADNQVLVKVRAASVNPLDWHYLHGKPYLMRLEAGIGAPTNVQLGVDFAGTVEAAGKNVTGFKAGDAVFGSRGGAFAEYVSVRANGTLALKPANVSFEQAAAVPVAALTALQALRDKGHVQAEQKVLINGASGGVGTFAVQIAKNYGAEVTAVCSARNVALVRSLGADHVVDYTQEDFTLRAEKYDLIVDVVGTHSLLEYRRVLNPQGTLVIIGSLDDGAWLGPLADVLKAYLIAPFVSQKVGFMLANSNQRDLALLRDWLQAGKLKAVIDRAFSLSEVPAAIRYLEQGHARGKVVITLADGLTTAP